MYQVFSGAGFVLCLLCRVRRPFSNQKSLLWLAALNLAGANSTCRMCANESCCATRVAAVVRPSDHYIFSFIVICVLCSYLSVLRGNYSFNTKYCVVDINTEKCIHNTLAITAGPAAQHPFNWRCCVFLKKPCCSWEQVIEILFFIFWVELIFLYQQATSVLIY